MAKRKIAGGRIGSMKELEKSLKSKGNPNVRVISAENSLTVRFLEDPEDWHGYHEHYYDGNYMPCADGCPACASDDPDEKRRTFKYLANAYVVDDQKVRAVKLPKSLVEILAAYKKKYGTLLDRDYELSRTGSGQNDTRYMGVPETPTKMKLSRFTPLDLSEVLQSMLGDDDDDDDDDEPVAKKKKKSKKSDPSPWQDDDEDDDEPVVKKSKKKKSASSKSGAKKSKPAVKRTVKRK